ncbi:MAG: ankyrin repeat domain-containing protein [bacterium]
MLAKLSFADEKIAKNIPEAKTARPESTQTTSLNNTLNQPEKELDKTPTAATIDVSWLELMEALAQFGDKKKLDKYIQDYYQNNPDVANGLYPHLFYDAAITGNINFLNYLITYYPDRLFINYQNGPTVLGYIAGDNQLAIAELLLKAGLNPNDLGNTEADYPLSLAINSGNLQMVKLLLEYGASVHIGQAYHSPLGLLLDNNDLETLKVIDVYDFTLDPLDNELRQLIIAYLNAELVEEEVLSVLVQHGFDPRLYTNDQASFLEVAKEQVKNPDVLAMLADVSLAYDLTTPAQQAIEQPKSPQNAASATAPQQHLLPVGTVDQAQKIPEKDASSGNNKLKNQTE